MAAVASSKHVNFLLVLAENGFLSFSLSQTGRRFVETKQQQQQLDAYVCHHLLLLFYVIFLSLHIYLAKKVAVRNRKATADDAVAADVVVVVQC